MNGFLETLESRMFLSASALATLHTDEAVLKRDLVALKAHGSAAVKVLVADLKAAGLFTADKSQTAATVADLRALAVAESRAIASAVGKVNPEAAKLVSATARLLKEPGNAALLAKVEADQSTLVADAASKLAAITAANNTTALAADLNAFAADGGAVATDASADGQGLGNIDARINTDASKAFSTDVNALLVG